MNLGEKNHVLVTSASQIRLIQSANLPFVRFNQVGKYNSIETGKLEK